MVDDASRESTIPSGEPACTAFATVPERWPAGMPVLTMSPPPKLAPRHVRNAYLPCKIDHPVRERRPRRERGRPHVHLRLGQAVAVLNARRLAMLARSAPGNRAFCGFNNPGHLPYANASSLPVER